MTSLTCLRRHCHAYDLRAVRRYFLSSWRSCVYHPRSAWARSRRCWTRNWPRSKRRRSLYAQRIAGSIWESASRRWRFHARRIDLPVCACAGCRDEASVLHSNWQMVFCIPPARTVSLISVRARLPSCLFVIVIGTLCGHLDGSTLASWCVAINCLQ